MNSQLILEISLISVVVILAVICILFFRSSRMSIGLKLEKFLTLLLGAFLVMAGTVKFFEPFNTMFTSQIAFSELPFPFLARWAGQLGEISAGVLFLVTLFFAKKLSSRLVNLIFYSATSLTMIIMLVAIYVHLLPEVPAEVLPLQSKPPVLTLIIIAMTALNAYLFKKHSTNYISHQ